MASSILNNRVIVVSIYDIFCQSVTFPSFFQVGCEEESLPPCIIRKNTQKIGIPVNFRYDSAVTCLTVDKMQ